MMKVVKTRSARNVSGIEDDDEILLIWCFIYPYIVWSSLVLRGPTHDFDLPKNWTVV